MDLGGDGIRVGGRGAVVHEYHVSDRFEGLHEWPDQGGHRVVEEDHLVLSVVHDVGELVGKQAEVQGVRHPAGARWGEVELEVARGVPGEGGHPAVLADAQVVEDTAQAPRPLTPLAVGDVLDAGRRGGDHLLVGKQAGAALE